MRSKYMRLKKILKRFEKNPVENLYEGQDTRSNEKTKESASAGEEVQEGHPPRLLVF